MEADIQGGQDEGDDDMAVYFGEADPGTIEDRKRLKLVKMGQIPNWMLQVDQMLMASREISG
jgi:hypothetical protein